MAIRRAARRRRRGERLIVTGLTLIVLASAYGVMGKLWARQLEGRRMQALQQRVDAPVEIIRIELADTAKSAVSAAATPSVPPPTSPTPSQEETARCENLQKLQQENADFVGWIALPGTELNYPVMQSVDRPWHYLDHDFAGERSRSGLPFIEEACDLSGNRGNLILYGHNMKNGSMFGALHKLTDAAFYEANRDIAFDTPERTGTYRIVSVLHMTVGDEETFQFYRYPNLTDAAAFDEYANQALRHGLYPPDTLLTFGDELLTLVTCERNNKQGRLVVVAKRL